MAEQLLPLGSVVTLDLDGLPAFCIAGYYPTSGQDAHRYLGVPWPTGIVEGSDAMAFDDVTVREVLYRADESSEERALLDSYASLHEEREELLRAMGDELEKHGSTEASV